MTAAVYHDPASSPRAWYTVNMHERRITAHKTTLQHMDADDFDRDFWARLDPIDRLVEAWRMTEEVWELKGWNPGERGLSRSVARVVRG